MKDKIEMVKVKRKSKKQVTIQERFTGKEMTFESIEEASKFIGCTRVHLSGLISGKRKNVTKYIFTTD